MREQGNEGVDFECKNSRNCETADKLMQPCPIKVKYGDFDKDLS